MKKVLIISASPRPNGNSDTLANQFAKGAEESENEVLKINLQEKKINFCHACRACEKLGHCVQNDDMNEINNELMKADVIVFATPVYFYSMAGQLKTLIDRTLPIWTKLTDRDFYFIISSWDPNKDNIASTIEALRGFTRDCLTSAHEKGIIYANGCDEVGDVKTKPAFLEAYEAGKNC